MIAGADIRHVPMTTETEFLAALEQTIHLSFPKPRMLIVNFPSNPTAQCVERPFFEKLVALARQYGIWIVHDLAYADIVFDGWKAPSILEVEGARDVAVEFFTMSKSYNMAGWRVGFMVGNRELVAALARIKGYHDYGTFTPIQVAAIAALEGPQDCVREIAAKYQRRRDVLCKGLARGRLEGATCRRRRCSCGRAFPSRIAPRARSSSRKSSSPTRRCPCRRAWASASSATATSASRLIENENRIRQAVRGIREMLRRDGVGSAAAA